MARFMQYDLHIASDLMHTKFGLGNTLAAYLRIRSEFVKYHR
ncbi:hypothetical protein VCR3J2_70132 [Vibrio coralliirubri]|nr:hypothetical protein VCR3J2_70132 [Vibrio coralliirubri]